jgi:hopanoid biosynthesis associated protein HpnK
MQKGSCPSVWFFELPRWEIPCPRTGCALYTHASIISDRAVVVKKRYTERSGLHDIGAPLPNPPRMKSVIINADDFGARPETNHAVLLAHREGILSSASLMVNELAADEAVQMARQNPSLAIGLHLVFSDGRASGASKAAGRLVRADGRFPSLPAKAGLVCFVSRRARAEMQAEMQAQFARFVESGLRFDHVNGHQHLHMHPTIWDAMLVQARAHRVPGIRVLNEEYVRRSCGNAMRRVEWIVFRALRRRCLRTLAGAEFVVTDRVYGHGETGRISADYQVELLVRLGGE